MCTLLRYLIDPPTGRFVRNPDPNGKSVTIMRGKEPNNPISEFVAAPVSKGSLVLIHGNVVHRSEHNHSDKSRHAYTLHLVDFHDTTYSEENWYVITVPFALFSKHSVSMFYDLITAGCNLLPKCHFQKCMKLRQKTELRIDE